LKQKWDSALANSLLTLDLFWFNDDAVYFNWHKLPEHHRW